VLRSRLIAAAAGAALLPLGTVCADDADVGLELNKLEPVDEACRIYLVLRNGSATSYQALKLDLVLFGTDGVIAGRVALEAAPLLAGRTSVKLFDVPEITCGAIGSLLVNDVVACRDADQPIEGCTERLQLASRTAVEILK
jgi:hypothetical protein